MSKKKRSGFHKDTAALIMCPFFVREEKGFLYCEVCRFKFKSALMRREIVYGFCAHPEGYKNCEIYRATCRYYERRCDK